MRACAEHTSVYGDLGVGSDLDHVALVELGHHEAGRRVVLVVLLAVGDDVTCQNNISISQYLSISVSQYLNISVSQYLSTLNSVAESLFEINSFCNLKL